jgi:hypothetical protein
MTVAHNLPSVQVVLTEQQDGLAWLNECVNANSQVTSVQVAECDWRNYSGDTKAASDPLAAEPWDAIIGSDLIYNSMGATLLPCVLKALAGPGTIILYAHTKVQVTVTTSVLHSSMHTGTLPPSHSSTCCHADTCTPSPHMHTYVPSFLPL